MKKICLFVLSAFLTFSAFAQLEKGYVYLKNGTILKGKYVYTEDAQKLKIESAGNFWVFDATEVDSVTSSHVRRYNEIKQKESTSPFFYRAELGVLAGNAENSQGAPFSFHVSGNYRINSNVSAGVGFGTEFLKETYMPLFVNLEYKIRDSYSTPYFFVKGGYQLAIDESRAVYYDVNPIWYSSSFWPWGGEYENGNLDAKGGFLVNPGVGFQRMFSSGMGLNIAFGYQFHRLHYNGETDYTLNIDYNRMTIKLGILFN